MIECFKPKNFRPDSLATIDRMNSIIDDYAGQGFRLTGRQLYYQFVTNNWFANTERNYKNLLALLVDARYAGLVDWEAIEDRGRQPLTLSSYRSMEHCINDALEQFRLPVWETQPVYAELWVEKQALAGVLEPVADEFRATLMVNKGYSSASAMYEAAQRLAHKAQDRQAIVFYLGDHDPSGEDMVRDIESRLNEFAPNMLFPIEVQKLALTMEQIRRYKAPPNPAKKSDSRYEGYKDKHGVDSWELDALRVDVLVQIARQAFRGVMDLDVFEDVKRKEQADIAKARFAIRKAFLKKE